MFLWNGCLSNQSLSQTFASQKREKREREKKKKTVRAYPTVLNPLTKRALMSLLLTQITNTLELTLEQHRFELWRSTYICSIFSINMCYSTIWSAVGWIHRCGTMNVECWLLSYAWIFDCTVPVLFRSQLYLSLRVWLKLMLEDKIFTAL